MTRFSISASLSEVGTVTVMGSPPGDTVLAIPMSPLIVDASAPLPRFTTAEPATGHAGADGADHCGMVVTCGA
ncbi:hypothetical protein ACFQY4_37175 [Catellatospora bangladeshensis]|uniref:Uncharacterized protein n=1 Tax=Catellatospora bangladeshensis TaxID=310355 RepID=A0A8J3JMH5_9ACTN|nr:hypothetical protein Cba03nite_47200 [Catellatospora bangladeshensis]